MELWDAYNSDGTLAGVDLVRGKKIPFNYFHMVCEAVIQHIDGDYLLMQRAYNKEIYPGKWEIGAGGSALKGESNIEAILREIKEETGIDTGELVEIYNILHQKHQTFRCHLWIFPEYHRQHGLVLCNSFPHSSNFQ